MMKSTEELAIAIAQLHKAVCNLNFYAEIEEGFPTAFASYFIGSVPSLLADIATSLYDNPKYKHVSHIEKIIVTDKIKEYFANHPTPDMETTVLQFMKDLDGLKNKLRTHQYYMHGYMYLLPEGLQNEDVTALLQRAVNAGLLRSNYLLSKGVTKSQAYIIAYAVIRHLHLGRGCWSMFGHLWYGKDNRLASAYIPKLRNDHINMVKELYPEEYST